MFNRRRRRAEAIRREFDQIAANARHLHSYEFDAPIREARPDSDPAQSPAETGESFLPTGMRVSGDQQFGGRMMRHPAPLLIDGTARTCPECGVDRDWLVLCIGPDIWLRCRSAHETYEPALSGAWYASISGTIQEVFTSKDAGIAKEGFDGAFSGITFPE